MEKVNKIICAECKHYKAYSNTQEHWECYDEKRRMRQTIYKNYSKPPVNCPYKNMTLDEARTDQIADRLFA